MQNIESRIISIISDKLGVLPEDITREDNLFDDLNADSLDIVELIMNFELNFNIEISDDDVVYFKNVGDVLDYLMQRMPDLANNK